VEFISKMMRVIIVMVTMDMSINSILPGGVQQEGRGWQGEGTGG
jgi:hypothetical protein